LTFRPVVTAAAASASSSLLRARLTLDIYGIFFRKRMTAKNWRLPNGRFWGDPHTPI